MKSTSTLYTDHNPHQELGSSSVHDKGHTGYQRTACVPSSSCMPNTCTPSCSPSTSNASDANSRTSLLRGLDFLWLELTSRCNLQCVHCYAESGPSSALT